MPRQKSPVKKKHNQFLGLTPLHGKSRNIYNAQTIGAVDIHFHGAFGIDVVSASSRELSELATKLYQVGYAAFCPTTLSLPQDDLLATVSRIGKWIRSIWDAQNSFLKSHMTYPLGIHLEGPFINPHASGAHPQTGIRPFSFEELEALWETSQKTLKIITIAPEFLSAAMLKKLGEWAKQKKTVLSMGHSLAKEKIVITALRAGFRNITHAWNAMPFHHRSPGILGVVLGKNQNPGPGNDIFLELIPDQVHVCPEVLDWTIRIHRTQYICFVSDCVPAAHFLGRWVNFGPLKIRNFTGKNTSKKGCLLESGHLAGGAQNIIQSFKTWLNWQRINLKRPLIKLFESQVTCLTEAPLNSLGIDNALRKQLRTLKWKISENQIQVDGSQSRS